MSTFQTYISFVIQDDDKHVHDFIIADLALPKYNFYLDNTSQEIIKWAEDKQKNLSANKKIIVLNYFNISNIK